MLLEYSAIDPKVCQEAGVVRGKNLKKIYQRMSFLYDNLETTG